MIRHPVCTAVKSDISGGAAATDGDGVDVWAKTVWRASGHGCRRRLWDLDRWASLVDREPEKREVT